MSTDTKTHSQATPVPTRAASGSLLSLYALTPVHPGSGATLGAVDLPIQRERHTQWPTIAGSALKGILRDACRETLAPQYQDDVPTNEPNPPQGEKPTRLKKRRDYANADQTLVWLFGPPTQSASDGAGTLAPTDARLLAFPVRSLNGVFAWATCPSALSRFNRDAALAGLSITVPVPSPAKNQAIVPDPAKCPCLIGTTNSLVLEEFDFTLDSNQDCAAAAQTVADLLIPEPSEFDSTRAGVASRLVVLHDDDFTHFVRHATEIQARIGLDYETKTVRDGALFYQEFLPSETLLYSVVLSNAARLTARPSGLNTTATETLRNFLPAFVQIGGDETTGKGFCATRLWSGNPNKTEAADHA